jgi:hypothetical protein
VKALAIAIGLFISVVGLGGVIAPSLILDIGTSLLTPTALYVVAAFRVGVGVVLIWAAADARLPIVLRVIGAVIIVAGVLTFFLGVEHSRAILDWWSNQGPMFMRLCLALPMVLGLFIVYVLSSPRRTAA